MPAIDAGAPLEEAVRQHRAVLLTLLSADGGAIGNTALREAVEQKLRQSVDAARRPATTSRSRRTIYRTRSSRSRRRGATKSVDEGGVLSYRHADKRRNNPEVGMVDPDSDPDEGKTRYAYDPHAIREAGDLFPRPKMIVFCAFTFDPEAARDIDATRGITALKAQMNTDLLTEDLKKAREQPELLAHGPARRGAE